MPISKKALREKLVERVGNWVDQIFKAQKECDFDYCSLSFEVELGLPEEEVAVIVRAAESFEDMGEMAEEGCCDTEDRH